MPLVDPDELEQLLSIDADRAELLVDLATRAVAAYLWPNTIPADPVPAPLAMVGLTVALRLNRAAADTSGDVVSESIGTYTYRLARAVALDGALWLTEWEKRELSPWAPAGRRRVYDVDTCGFGGSPATFPLLAATPAAGFERDLEDDDDEVAGGAVATA